MKTALLLSTLLSTALPSDTIPNRPMRIKDYVVDWESFITDEEGPATRSVPDFSWTWGKVERIPHTGTPHIPVILVEYADKLLTYNRVSDWDELLNGTETQHENPLKSHGSVAEYFDHCSNGQFRPVFDLYGPYNMQDYFGKDSIDANYSHYGVNKETKVVEVAFKMADKDIDFSQYATVNPEQCDLVYVIAAGESHALTNNYKDIHPMCGINYFSGQYDGMRIRNWGISNEILMREEPLQTGIGVFCHELSHAMGLPDLYPYVGKKNYNNDEPEEWDLMDNGANSLDGFWPHPYNAWERDVMGWIDPDTLSESRSVTLYPLSDPRGKACKFVNPHNDKEWWMIENIPAGVTLDENGHQMLDYWYSWAMQKADGNNGLLIMHLDNNDTGNGAGYLSLDGNGAPNDPCSMEGGQPHGTVLAADSLLVSAFNIPYRKTTLPDGSVVETTQALYDKSVKGDLYPGSSKVTQLWKFFNYYGNKNNDGKITDLTDEGYAIRNIKLNEDGSVSFDFYYGNAPSAIQEIRTTEPQDVIDQDEVYRISPNLIVRNRRLYWIK